MKQTAVKWLAQKFEELLVKLDFNEISEDEYLEEWKNIITIAKEMEKQQQGYSEEDMKKAFYNGYCCENKLGIEVTFNKWFEQFKKKQ